MDIIPKQRLTGREVEVFQLMMLGYSNKEISNALSVSIHTAKAHVYNIYMKLSLNCRKDFFAYVIEKLLSRNSQLESVSNNRGTKKPLISL